MHIRHLIGGRAHESAEQFETLNPVNQSVLAAVSRGGVPEVYAAVAAAKSAFGGWAATPVAERARILHRLGDLIAAHTAVLAGLETADTGQPITQTATQMLPRAAEVLHRCADAGLHLEGRSRPTPTHLSYTLTQPVGVCALIGPCCTPLVTAAWKVGCCLVAGNTAVLKGSELAPLTVARLGELALEAGVPAGVLNVVHGYGAEAGEPLVRHPDVRAVSFTGSTLTGQRIVQAGGIKQYGMELGGKSPFVVFDDADFERAIDAALYMNFSHNGERCAAGSRLLVQRPIYARFAERLAERVAQLTVGDPMDERTAIGPLVSRNHQAKVRNYIALGVNEGAQLLVGGSKAPSLPDELARGNYVRPSVLANVDNAMRVAQDEIFGPVACLIPFADEAEAVRIANASPYGLASYLFTENAARAHRVAAAIESGACYVNGAEERELRQPGGGIKASGIGRGGGPWGRDVFLVTRQVSLPLGAHPLPHWGG